MSSYFASASQCGYRGNPSAALRLAQRTVTTTTPEADAARRAEALAPQVPAQFDSTTRKRPSVSLVSVAKEALPQTASEAAHRAELERRAAELKEAEARDQCAHEQATKARERDAARVAVLLHEAEERERRGREGIAEANSATRSRVKALRRGYHEKLGASFLWADTSKEGSIGGGDDDDDDDDDDNEQSRSGGTASPASRTTDAARTGSSSSGTNASLSASTPPPVRSTGFTLGNGSKQQLPLSQAARSRLLHSRQGIEQLIECSLMVEERAIVDAIGVKDEDLL